MLMLTWIQSFHLFLYGWVKIDNNYYVNCKEHGATIAIRHGFHNIIECKICYVRELKDEPKKK